MNSKKLLLGIIIGGIFGVIAVLIMKIVYDKSNISKKDGFKLVANDSASLETRLQQILVYGDYIDLDTTDYLLIPLGMQTVEAENSRGVKSKSSREYLPYDEAYNPYKYNFYSLNFSDYNNIIFYNKKTDSTHLLFQRPAIISQFYFPHTNDTYTGKKYWFILMGVRDIDSNLDGYINSADAETVYITDLLGEVKTQISPSNTQLIDWFIDEDTNTLLLKIREDSNNDKIFNYFDDIEIVKTSLSNPSIGTEIIGKKMRKDISNILRRIK